MADETLLETMQEGFAADDSTAAVDDPPLDSSVESPASAGEIPAPGGEEADLGPFSILETMKARGIDPDQHGISDDRGAFDYLLNSAGSWYDEASNAAQNAQQLQQQLAAAQYRIEQFQGQQQAAEAAAVKDKEAADAPPYWGGLGLPEYSANWQHQVYTDPQSGETKLRDGADPNLLQKLRAYGEAREPLLDQLVRDPAAAVMPGIEPKLNEIVQGKVKDALTAYHESREVDGYLDRSQEWMFEGDKETLTPHGQVATEWWDWGKKIGMPTQGRQALGEIAAENAMLRQMLADSPPAAEQYADQEKRQQEWLQEHNRTPGRGGGASATDDDEALNPTQSLADMMRAGMTDIPDAAFA